MMKTLPLRLQPNQDLKQTLKRFVAQKEVEAGCMVTAVGSLKQATLRFANRKSPRILREKFEIVSLVGTLSIHGVHLHLAIADKFGKVLGGHLEEGCLIYTTAEIVIGELLEHRFRRAIDRKTGYQELVIEPRELTNGWYDRTSLSRLGECAD